MTNIPAYAILSHTWAEDNHHEVTFAEVLTKEGQRKAGYAKIQFCAAQASRDGIEYFWVDTCCINKNSHSELSEAITSTFRWYQNATKCYVYLSDVSACKRDREGDTQYVWQLSFRSSRWFTRGWTLQELLAPKEVVFFSREGTRLGTKHDFEGLLHEVTRIPVTALRGQSLSQFSVDERLRWIQGRITRRKEDQAYCLFGIFGVYIPPIYGEGDHAFVRLLKEIDEAPKVTFSLRVAEGATFDAYGQTHQACHPATRVDLIRSVHSWAQNVNGKSIFWLNGMAGTGKSTISCTIAQQLVELGSGGPIRFGASFFFKRGEGDRASANLLFPTIARQLASHISHFDVFLAHAVNAHPQICSKNLGEQFQKLICEPLQRLPIDMGHSTYIVIVDALDECNKEDDIQTMLQLWSRLPVTPCVRLRLFLTSRPELVIRLGFKEMSCDTYQDVVLHEVPQPIIQHDIYTFLRAELTAVRKRYNLEPAGDRLTDNWPDHDLLQELTDIAVPLFIVAATICRFTGRAELPHEELSTILKYRRMGHLSGIGNVYSVVLETMIARASERLSQENICHEFRLIVGAIICLAEPLSRTALAALLDITSGSIQTRLRSLHALLQVPIDSDGLIRPLHLSFAEYLTSPETKDQPYSIDAQATHCLLWKQCLRLLSGPHGLREDICGLRYPGQLRGEISASLIAQHLPLAVEYACRHWVHHLRCSTFKLSDGDEVYSFLQYHFLHWLEALSLLDRLADSIELIDTLRLQATVCYRLPSSCGNKRFANLITDWKYNKTNCIPGRCTTIYPS